MVANEILNFRSCLYAVIEMAVNAAQGFTFWDDATSLAGSTEPARLRRARDSSSSKGKSTAKHSVGIARGDEEEIAGGGGCGWCSLWGLLVIGLMAVWAGCMVAIVSEALYNGRDSGEAVSST